MGITERGIVIGLATGLVESALTVYANAKVPGSLDLPHDAVGSDHLSVGVQQQQVVETPNGFWWGPVALCQDPTRSTRLFYTRLAKLDYNGPNSPGSYAQAVQGSSFPDRYDERMDDAQAIYDRLAGGPPPVPDNRPDFNEYSLWSSNHQNRDGTKIDLFLLHTEEGNSNADGLAKFLKSTEGTDNPRSYNYTISQASDNGVTVVDVVDTDYAAFAVGNSNDRSINLCFAGSKAGWSRAQWLAQSRAIDVAAYLAVADCKKYGIPTTVIPPPYNSGPPGIADHRFCKMKLRDGNDHTDVGDNFPWDVFTTAVNKYASGLTPEIPVMRGPTPVGPADDQLTLRWNCLGGQTNIEALAEIRDHLLGTDDRQKQGAL